MGNKYGVHFSVYKCLYCDGWHCGKNRENKVKSDEIVENTPVSPLSVYYEPETPITYGWAGHGKSMFEILSSMSEETEEMERNGNFIDDAQCNIAYEMSLAIFDNEKFRPNAKLKWGWTENGEEPGFYNICKDILPAYYWGYEDPVYSPHNSNRVFKLNVNCFRDKSPIIAVRDDCGCQIIDLREGYGYKLRAGLEPFIDVKLQEQYPDWLFLRINYSTADDEGFAVFTNQLEKEFSVEVAHLGTDGKLHRIYVLNY